MSQCCLPVPTGQSNTNLWNHNSQFFFLGLVLFYFYPLEKLLTILFHSPHFRATTTSTMTPINQRSTPSRKSLLQAVAAAEEEEGAVEAKTISPPSGRPRWSHVRSRNTSRARLWGSRCQGELVGLVNASRRGKRACRLDVFSQS